MTIYGRSEELVSRCVECDLAEPESLASLGGSAPGVVDGILSICHTPNMTHPYICQSRQPSDHCTIGAKGPSVCQPHESAVRHTTTTTCPSVCQSYTTSDHHTDFSTSLSDCQSRQSYVRRTIEPTSPSVCQPHHTSVRHAMKTNSPSMCQPHHTSVHHTNIARSLSVCPSKESSDRHTTSRISPSLCQSPIPSVCHNVIQTSPSVCQSRHSSVCYPTRDVRHAVCLLSVTSILPSANPTVKMRTSYPIRNFPQEQNPGKFLFVCPSTESSVHHPDSPSINSSAFAANPSRLPSNYGENSMVNYLHENLVKSPTVSTSYNMSVIAPVHASYIPFIHTSYVRPVRTSCVTSDDASVRALSIQPIRTSCITSVIAPVRASSIQPIRTSCITSVIAPVCESSIPSVLPYNDERQEFPDGFPGNHYREKNSSEIMATIPHDITLTLQQANFPEEIPDTTKR